MVSRWFALNAAKRVSGHSTLSPPLIIASTNLLYLSTRLSKSSHLAGACRYVNVTQERLCVCRVNNPTAKAIPY